MNYRTKIKLTKIGPSSYGIIIPKAAVDFLNLKEKEFEMIIEEENLIQLIIKDRAENSSKPQDTRNAANTTLTKAKPANQRKIDLHRN